MIKIPSISKRITFKFSIDPSQNPDLVSYLLNISSKTKRGNWLLTAVNVFKTIETTFSRKLPSYSEEDIKRFVEFALNSYFEEYHKIKH
ncbi:MAG: hypothetical protein N3D73_03000 [Candidatus Diapherotrites archaeon]|nr:hypothetical protein [Candidatus Diapherotrites archaeon]